MILLHGGTKSPQLINQKEIGFHLTNDPIEAIIHMSTAVTAVEYDVSSAVYVEDQNDWSSLRALQEICKSAGLPVEDAVQEYRSAGPFSDNTLEASSFIRNYLTSNGVFCIGYTDNNERPGAQCYIVLEDVDFRYATLEEAYPNMVLANNMLYQDPIAPLDESSSRYNSYYGYPDRKYIIYLQVNMLPGPCPVVEDDGSVRKIPRSLYTAPADDVVQYVRSIRKRAEESFDYSEIAAEISRSFPGLTLLIGSDVLEGEDQSSNFKFSLKLSELIKRTSSSFDARWGRLSIKGNINISPSTVIAIIGKYLK